MKKARLGDLKETMTPIIERLITQKISGETGGTLLNRITVQDTINLISRIDTRASGGIEVPARVEVGAELLVTRAVFLEVVVNLEVANIGTLDASEVDLFPPPVLGHQPALMAQTLLNQKVVL